MTQQTIVLAADHAGYELKEIIKKYLEDNGKKVFDVGAHKFVADDDYPIFMTEAAMMVARDMKGETKAIIFGGSGQGEAVVANRFPGVRATVWYGGKSQASDQSVNPDHDVIKLSREHNDSNILSIGARFVTADETKKAVELWLSTQFSNEEKHQRRILEIDNIE
ncbi:MAG: RpiB/LacA/LacB family sugar-phosphate isomerase [Candidatus Paceibacterota bacterium]|jgi:ribose 5-phosphate isomerase B